ncbi:MAG: DNA-binding protein [Hyphomicrobiales bacterium]|nr:prolyl-tRNA synthetase associated domain-containing protein [Hyphomicrobiales bacterium]PCH51378.1 MAG: DNA-binding protein [Hyphomicrobiales bacterium]
MPETLPTSPSQLLAMLDDLNYKTVTHTHQAVFTVEESNEVTANIKGGHTKNLFLKDKKDNYFLIIAGHHAKIKLNKAHKLIGAHKRVSFASEEKLMEYLGVKPGSVNAFAPLNDKEGKVVVIIDAPLLENEFINAHPLTNTMTTTISKEDLLAFLTHVNHAPKIVQLSEIDDNAHL